MLTLIRSPKNPILSPDPDNAWEKDGAFNGCVSLVDGTYHMVYRALSSPKVQNGVTMQVSSVGYATSTDGVSFGEHRLLFAPEEDWEIYGCEDPRITYLNDKFYIFYTALSVYPFAAYGIKLAVAITADFKTFEKHPVTTFNSKAMGLFPEKIDGKMAALLTMHTDLPPAKIAYAEFDKEEDIWSPYFWSAWYEHANDNILHVMRDMRDQVELGAPPIKTDEGWLVIYSYITNYLSDNKSFGIEAMLLDLNDPRTIIGRSKSSLLSPEKDYELEGLVKNVIFPSGGLLHDDRLSVYYGAADTRCALATCNINELLQSLTDDTHTPAENTASHYRCLTRYKDNPIITPAPELDWQAAGTFNPSAIYEHDAVHLVYRAQAMNGESVLGYAKSNDGYRIDENLTEPIYTPREDFEKNADGHGNAGCEDPRISKIDDMLVMTYTAYDGKNPPRVALTTIAVNDFLDKKWDKWEKPRLISSPGVDNKDACIVKNAYGDGFLAFHRLGDSIWLDFLTNLNFAEREYLAGTILAKPRKDMWDNVKIGIAAPPVPTDKGWLLLYHAVSEPGFHYKVGAMILDKADPRNILVRTDEPILSPEEPYEKEGQVANVVFPCGTVVIDGTLFVYYGGADKVIGLATKKLEALLSELLS